jgi:hypothetical protein
VVIYAVIRAVAVAGAVAIAFGQHLPYADWMTLLVLSTKLNSACRGQLHRSVPLTVPVWDGSWLGQ